MIPDEPYCLDCGSILWERGDGMAAGLIGTSITTNQRQQTVASTSVANGDATRQKQIPFKLLRDFLGHFVAMVMSR